MPVFPVPDEGLIPAIAIDGLSVCDVIQHRPACLDRYWLQHLDRSLRQRQHRRHALVAAAAKRDRTLTICRCRSIHSDCSGTNMPCLSEVSWPGRTPARHRGFRLLRELQRCGRTGRRAVGDFAHGTRSRRGPSPTRRREPRRVPHRASPRFIAAAVSRDDGPARASTCARLVTVAMCKDPNSRVHRPSQRCHLCASVVGRGTFACSGHEKTAWRRRQAVDFQHLILVGPE